MSYDKELEALEKNIEDQRNQIMLNNVYVQAINKAVNKEREQIKKNKPEIDRYPENWDISQWLVRNGHNKIVLQDFLLTEEDLNKLRDLQKKFWELLEKNKEKYVVGNLLLQEASTLEEKLQILRGYTKDIPL